jgi:signal transduction histidine kinase
VYFRTDGDDPLCDIRAPVLDGQLGVLHVGMSRRAVVAATTRLSWALGIAMALALLLALSTSQLLASWVTRPLQRVEAAVSSFPGPGAEADLAHVGGTREVNSLARGFVTMIHRVQALEAQRTAARERMIHAERLAALGELAAGLSHEVRNPLDGMLECLRYLGADPDKSPRADKYYPMLEDGLQRIAQAMRGMLTLARSGHQVDPTDCGVGEIFERLRLLVATHVKNHDVDLTWSEPGTCVCRCDRQGLTQAGLNLVLNAVHAADGSAGRRVRVGATCDEQWAYLTFEDSGPGVGAELAERVFEPFFTTKPPEKGTGLGLSVSRQLIRAAGGELELSPEPSELGGARFVIRLPKASCGPENHDPPSP